MIFIQRASGGRYAIKDVEEGQQARYGKMLGTGSEQDVRRELKTFGLGKKNGTSLVAGWGAVEIVVYPPGTDIPIR